MLHSGLSAGERFDEWRRIRSGEARVIIGARSAVFAPARNIGVIVVDEEHETSYLSDKRPRYDAREVARYRADAAGAVLLLGSATPSISTYMRTMPGVRPENALKRIELNRRANNRPLPQVEIVDMRKEFQLGNHSIFSASLRSAMEDCLARGQQCMLFINRRGYSNFVSCRNCGKAVKCPNCDVTMTYHQWDDLLRCHYCGEVMQPPKTCPSCGSRYIKYFGAGTQKVEEEVRNLFPTVQVGRMDVDTHLHQGRAPEDSGDLPHRGDPGAGGYADDRQGAGFSQRDAGGGGGGGSFPESAGLSQHRAHLPIAHPGGGPGGPGGNAWSGGGADLRAGPLRHSAGRQAGLSGFLPPGKAPFDAPVFIRPLPSSPASSLPRTRKRTPRAAAETAEEKLNAYIDGAGIRRDIVQMRALEAPIRFLRNRWRWQVFLKMYFKADQEAVTRKMRDVAAETAEGVQAEMEVNPVNMI